MEASIICKGLDLIGQLTNQQTIVATPYAKDYLKEFDIPEPFMNYMQVALKALNIVN